ncbi:MAG: hypothetical protein ACI4DV_01440 [Lachnospiraceae bacterium]
MMDIIRIVSMVAAGGIGGFLVPGLAQKVIDYKGKQKNREMPVQPGYLTMVCRGCCALIAAAGLGLCGYLQSSWLMLILSAIIWIQGMVIIIVDMRIHLIANESILVLLGSAVLFRLLTGGAVGLFNSFGTMIAVIAVWMILGKVLGFWKVGAGDVKLCGVIGFLYGYPAIQMPLLFMAIGLIIFCVGGLVLRKMTLRSMFAMAPFLAAGMLAGLPYLFWTMNGGGY